jgi:hypothetical protein
MYVCSLLSFVMKCCCVSVGYVLPSSVDEFLGVRIGTVSCHEWTGSEVSECLQFIVM